MRIFCVFLLLASTVIKVEAADCDGLVQSSGCFNLTDLIKVERISSQYPSLYKVLQDPERFRLQLIYTQIDRDSANQPHLSYYSLGVNSKQYFYPASTVKLPISLLALEWLNEAGLQAVTMNSPMLTDAVEPWQTSAHSDTSAESGLPSIAHYIKKILLVSDNDGSNRLYELLGQERINRRLSELGLYNSLITHRLSVSLREDQNRQYNPIRFFATDGTVALSLPQRETTQQYLNEAHPSLGSAYMLDDKLVPQPMDFTYKNRLSLQDLDGVVKRLVFPELFNKAQQLKLTEEQRQFVLRYMSMLPGNSDYPSYDKAQYPDNYSKFLLFGGSAQSIPDHIRIFNKTGWAYGHMIDSAYVIDLKHNIEFFVSAVIYANQNDILNDDTYETEQVGLPFLNELGQFIYQSELKRRKKQEPDLSYFKQIIN